MDTKLIDVFRMWEETSYQLERLQANTECVYQEWKGNGIYSVIKHIYLVLNRGDNCIVIKYRI